MVRSKKIISLCFALIIICAMIAPCAISAFAEDDTSIPISTAVRNMPRIDNGVLNSGSTSTQYPQIMNTVISGGQSTIGFGFYVASTPTLFSDTDYYVTFIFSTAFLFDPTSDIDLRINRGGSDSNTFTLSHFDLTYNFDSETGYYTYYFGVYFSRNADFQGFYVAFKNLRSVVPMDRVTQITLIQAYLYNRSYVPEPEPEPVPVPDNPYTYLEPTVYFTNSKLSSSSSYTHLNHPTILPEDFQTPYDIQSGVASYDVLGGTFVDGFSDILTDNIVLRGACTFYMKGVIDDPVIPSNITADFYFMAGAEPSVAGSIMLTPPSSWEQNYNVDVMKFLDGHLVTFRFYIVTSSDLRGDLGFSPTCFSCVFHCNDVSPKFQYGLSLLQLGYYQRSSSIDEVPDDFPNNITPTYGNNGTYVGNPNNYDSSSANTYAYLTGIYSQYDPQIKKIVDDFLNNFDFPAGIGDSDVLLLDLLNSLVDSITSTSTEFNISLPSVSIPWANNTQLTLWQSQTIPFKEFIDNTPQAYIIIITFFIISSSFFLHIYMVLHLLSSVTHGNAKLERM